jgi:hypothetical protein
MAKVGDVMVSLTPMRLAYGLDEGGLARSHLAVEGKDGASPMAATN